LAAALVFAACAATQGRPDYASVLAHPERPAPERDLDGARKPAEVLAFYGVKKGDKVADLLAGRGYYTIILSQIVGPEGVVYSTNTRERDDWSDRFKKQPFTNVRTVVGPVDKVGLPQDGSLDFALTHLNYHDLPRPARGGMNKLVLAALKRGGIYGVVDHSAREGSGDSDSNTLHRIDKRLVIKEVTEAGFKLADEGTMLARPDDKRDFNVNKVRNQDDRFVLKFVKP
jgi:predicted methyltransferase